jgi:hypothetical protein
MRSQSVIGPASFGRNSSDRMPVWPKPIWPNRPNWPKILQKWTEQNINLTLSQKITLKLHYIVTFAELHDNIIFIVKISPITDIQDPIKKNFQYIIRGIFRTFSQKMQNLSFFS